MRFSITTPRLFVLTSAILAAACSGKSSVSIDDADANTSPKDGAVSDGSASDAAASDAGVNDATLTDLDATNPTSDGAGIDAATDDASDAGATGTTSDAQGDVSVIDAGNARRIASGASSIVGVTSDDFVVYADENGQALSVPINGGASAVQITPNIANATLSIRGEVIFVWENCDDNNYCDLAYVKSGEAKTSLATKSMQGIAEASRDGTRLMYSANETTLDAGAKAMDLDGTIVGGATTKIAASIAADPDCAPTFALTANHAFAASCVPGDTNYVATLTGYSATFTSPFTYATDTGTRFTVSTDETYVASVGTFGGGLRVFPINSATALTITADQVDYGPPNNYPDLLDAYPLPIIVSNDSAIVYTGNGIWRSSITTPAPLNVATFGIVQGASLDGAYVLASTITNDVGTAIDLFDLYLVPTASANATAIPISTTTDAGAGSATHFGELDRNVSMFTRDDAYAIYIDDVDVTTATGSLRLQPVGGGTAITLSTNRAWRASAAAGAVIFNDNWTESDNASSGAVADLREWTGSTDGGAPILAGGADTAYAITAAGDAVVYSLSTNGTGAGIYVRSIP